jgi:HSF-type DNA-binding
MKVKSGDFELDLNRFPDKLRWLLDNEVAPQALWWLSGGDAIGINKNAFEAQLLEQEFRGNKFSSITRKLNRW